MSAHSETGATQLPTEIRDVACTQCGCVCDDLTVRVQSNRLISWDPPCSLADPWYKILSELDDYGPPVQIQNAPVSFEQAVHEVTRILTNSRSPLIYGLSRSSTPGQRAATELADLIGATIDTTASTCHAPSIVALQNVGEATSTLGEVKNRCDLVIYWGSNPAQSHPRHIERLVDSSGRFVPQGRAGRHLVVVDPVPTATTELADTWIQLQPGQDFEMIWALRAIFRGQPIPEFVGGVPRATLLDLSERMLNCQYGVVFFGMGLAGQHDGHHTVQALLELVIELNERTRFVARRMRIHGDVAGADSVLCWQTGYPFSVNLGRGYPRYNPGEYTASVMLENQEADCVILVGGEGVKKMSAKAQANLRTIPTILLDYPGRADFADPTVRFTTAVYGVHREGIAYRMDEVPLPLKPFLHSTLPADHDVLNAIIESIRGSLSPV